ncbi:hypothetical protein [Burkholderia vietnamiensis]|uniref:hypothetical protein n=1 Tax=Burkholderia vietnamiensis TaxID=60552 RepID=UPI001BA70E08|nr:hypothetical protein [Burkholderia vietnamiensis]
MAIFLIKAQDTLKNYTIRVRQRLVTTLYLVFHRLHALHVVDSGHCALGPIDECKSEYLSSAPQALNGLLNPPQNWRPSPSSLKFSAIPLNPPHTTHDLVLLVASEKGTIQICAASLGLGLSQPTLINKFIVYACEYDNFTQKSHSLHFFCYSTIIFG